MRSHFLIGAGLAAAVVAGSGCDRASNPGSDAHAVPAPSQGGADAELEPQSLTLFTPKVELFMEYPTLVAGEPAKFVSHFTVLETGEPVRSGKLSFEGVGDSGKAVTFGVDLPARDGLFTPTHTFEAPGRYRAKYVLSSPQVNETVDLGEMLVFASKANAIQASSGEAESAPSGAVQFLLEQQWKIAMRLEQASRRTLVRRLQVPGQIEAPAGHMALVGAPVAGRLRARVDDVGTDASIDHRWPSIGEHVEAGQVLAYVEPPLPATEAAQLSANRAQLATLEIDLLLRGTEVQRTIAEAKTRLNFATRAMERARTLREKGVGTDQQFDEAEQAYELARNESDAAQSLKTQYEQIRERVDVLRGEGSPEAPGSGRAIGDGLRLPLMSPIGGELVSIPHIEGEHVDAQQEVFRVVNLEHVWIVGHVSEFDLAELPARPGVLMRLAGNAGSAETPVDVLGAGGRLVHIGTVIDPSSRTIPIRYEMPNAEGRYRAGMFADLLLETARSHDGVAIPIDCVVTDNGKPIAFVLIEGELFDRRELKLGIRDGAFVEVLSGIQTGERVAGRGSYAIHLSSLSPAQFGEGHAH